MGTAAAILLASWSAVAVGQDAAGTTVACRHATSGVGSEGGGVVLRAPVGGHLREPVCVCDAARGARRCVGHNCSTGRHGNERVTGYRPNRCSDCRCQPSRKRAVFLGEWIALCVKRQVVMGQFGYDVVGGWAEHGWREGKNGQNRLPPGTTTTNWDLMYGGGWRNNWLKTSGASRAISFDRLRHDQIVNPCGSFAGTYTSKYELCKIISRIQPGGCFTLPQDRAALLATMKGKVPGQKWVLKYANTDYTEITFVDGQKFHVGQAVSYISTAVELPASTAARPGVGVLVQPYLQPLLGPSPWDRKTELRIYFVMTSATPVRLWYTRKIFTIMARSPYRKDAATGDQCVHDTHFPKTHTSVEQDYADCNETVPPEIGWRVPRFDKYADGMGWSEQRRWGVIDSIMRVLRKVVYDPAVLARHGRDRIVRGVHASNASCFMLLRADVGLTEDETPVVYEINPGPFLSCNSKNREMENEMHFDLFKMLEMDRDSRLPAPEREAFELASAGSWLPMYPPGTDMFEPWSPEFVR